MVIGRDIIQNLNKNYHKGTLTPNKQLGQALNSIFRAMTRPKDDANYKQYKKYFPKYNHKLLNRLTKAYFDQPVNVQNTFVKQVMDYSIKESVNEGQKKFASKIVDKFDQAYLKFSREVRDVIKMMDRSTGDKTDGKIIDKAYSKGLIPLDKLMKSWNKTQQKNPHIDESINEAERDYKDEYKKFQSSTKAKKYRAELNKYNRKKGTYGNGDGKDASHKGGKIVGFESQSKNRGRAEKSRLKKEDTRQEIEEYVDGILDSMGEEFMVNEAEKWKTVGIDVRDIYDYMVSIKKTNPAKFKKDMKNKALKGIWDRYSKGGKMYKNESAKTAEVGKIIKYLMKKGDTKKTALDKIEQNYDYVSKKYRTAPISKKAQILTSLQEAVKLMFQKNIKVLQ